MFAHKIYQIRLWNWYFNLKWNCIILFYEPLIYWVAMYSIPDILQILLAKHELNVNEKYTIIYSIFKLHSTLFILNLISYVYFIEFNNIDYLIAF